MDHYAADAAAVIERLDLRDTIHVGHSTGGGEVAHYAALYGKGRIAKVVLIGSVTPIMVKTSANPGGLPIEVFDGFRQQLAANRAQFYLDLASGPFYGYNRPGANVSQGVIENWWRQGMMGGAKAHYDGIKAFSETDFTEDLKSIDVPALVMHGDDDQIVPIRRLRAARRQAVEARLPEGLWGIPARHGHVTRRCDQRGPAGLHAGRSSADDSHRQGREGSPLRLGVPRRPAGHPAVHGRASRCHRRSPYPVAEPRTFR